jgi:4-hydroxy-tetrahydrodipicolinate synthase
VKTLSKHPNIRGLKDSERSLERVGLLAQTFSGNADFCLMSGWTVQSLFALNSGFDGIVPSTGNIVPKLFQNLYLEAQNKDKKAQEIQDIINPIADIHQKGKILSEVIPALKVMMYEKQLCAPYVMPPLRKSSDEDMKQIIAEMKDLNIDQYL